MTPRQLEEQYKQGKNITSLLRKEFGVEHNTREIIEISYDLQAGEYIKLLENESYARLKEKYSIEIAKTILSLDKPQTILEAGVGEATTLSGVLKNLPTNITAYGFDLSWSRVAYAKNWLDDKGFSSVRLASGDLFNAPFLDNSIDIVYTSHSIEPNGGNERPILKELYRITRKYLVLLEPSFELASNKARQRMESHGYCKNLRDISKDLGFDLVEHRLFPYAASSMNPTALTIIRKCSETELPKNAFACPRFKTPLEKLGGMLYSPESFLVYPILASIPCLRIENGILASKYKEVLEED